VVSTHCPCGPERDVMRRPVVQQPAGTQPSPFPRLPFDSGPFVCVTAILVPFAARSTMLAGDAWLDGQLLHLLRHNVDPC
jgi:hypothetical protein